MHNRTPRQPTSSQIDLIAERYETAHDTLDQLRVPRQADPDGRPLSVAARIELLAAAPPRAQCRRGR